MSAEPVVGKGQTLSAGRTIGLDVETVADPSIPTTLLRDIFECKEGDEPAASLSPALCSVACVGLAMLETGRRVAYARCAHPQEPGREEIDGGFIEYVQGEPALLVMVARALTGASRIVTFMGRRFDIPVLLHRMIAVGVSPPRALWTAAEENRYQSGLHFDVWDKLTLYGAASVKHGTTLRAFAVGHGLGDPKARHDGSKVATMTPQERALYCLDDVAFTLSLYRKWITARAESFHR